jgi:Ribosomal RNA-processing protein 12, HEAT repeats
VSLPVSVRLYCILKFLSSPGREPHAHLLPLLPIPHPAPLGHFVEYFVPLSERMFDLHQKADAERRANEAKMWDVLLGQIWTGLVGYCWGTRDLIQVRLYIFIFLLHYYNGLKIVLTSSSGIQPYICAVVVTDII